MKILLVVDKQGTAIDILADFIIRHNQQHAIDKLALHPKRPNQIDLEFLKGHIEDYDLVHWMYWKSWQKALDELGTLPTKKSILSHFNPYDVTKAEWCGFDRVVYCTQEQRDKVVGGDLVRLGVDEELWEYAPKQGISTIGMCANRIEGKKGVKEVAEAAKRLGMKFILVGRISKPEYFEEVKAVGCDLEFHENVDFKEMPELYQRMGVYVCNSVDNFETGPMPPMEAMLCGTPVVSTQIGTLAEVFEDQKNILFHDGSMEGITMAVNRIEEDDKLRQKIIDSGWNTAKQLNSVRFAHEYNKIYHDVVHPDERLVSVIVPYIRDRGHLIREIEKSIYDQTYKNVELVSVLDKEDGYNLAKSRNRGIIEARGDYLLFLDDRLVLDDKNSIKNFVNTLGNKEKTFLYGDKGAGKRSFVENFSFCNRQALINAGMFNERCEWYGGISQEIRERLRHQGWEFTYVPEAKAKPTMGTKNRWQKKKEIIKSKTMLYKLGLES